MYTIVTVIHVAVCLAIILVILLQTGKGSDMGAAFGGSSQTLFGSTGAATFLSKITTGVAVVFMLTSLGLTLLSAPKLTKSVIDKGAVPVTEPVAPEQGVDVQPQAVEEPAVPTGPQPQPIESAAETPSGPQPQPITEQPAQAP